MSTLLQIKTINLNAESDNGRVFDMTRRCAFAIWVDGDFDVKIQSEVYHVNDYCVFACMPFVNVEITKIRKSGRLILGSIRLADVLAVINPTVNSSNLLAIHQRPLVGIDKRQFDYITCSLKDYIDEQSSCGIPINNDPISQIQKEILICCGRLIVARVMKVYFSNINIDIKGHTHRDLIFQSFMLDLYENCRTHRDVMFYASRSGVSLKYFSTIIRILSGSRPSELIEMVVTGEAKSMLSDNTKSIKDIAISLNFPDTPTFTKYFQRITGLTPKAYRNSVLS